MQVKPMSYALVDVPLMERIEQNAALLVVQVQKMRRKPKLTVKDREALQRLEGAIQRFFGSFPIEARENYIIQR